MRARIHSYDSLRLLKACPICNGLGHVVSRQMRFDGGESLSAAPCRTCNRRGGALAPALMKAFALAGETEFQGLDIAIEQRAGQKRKWRDEEGREGHTVMVHPYGYIRGVKGADGDELDVYVGPDRDSDVVFVVNQRRIEDKRKFDEHKVMLGFATLKEAREAYLKHYQPRELGESLIGSIRMWTMDRFKAWLDRRGAKKKPLHKAGRVA